MGDAKSGPFRLSFNLPPQQVGTVIGCPSVWQFAKS